MRVLPSMSVNKNVTTDRVAIRKSLHHGAIAAVPDDDARETGNS